MTETTAVPSNGKVSIDYKHRVNFSRCHAGIEHVVRSIEVPPGLRAQLRIAGYSEKVPLPTGRSGGFSPPLDAHMFARLTAPVETQLVIEIEDHDPELHPILVSPLSAWGQRPEHALATAVFVLENDPVVAQFVRETGSAPNPAGTRPPEETAERLYERFRSFFGPCYLFQRMVFPPDEQVIRFPLQMKYDLGGTCLDLSLTYAAALYKSGVEPLLVILENEYGDSRHSLVGIWLPNPPPRRHPLPAPQALYRAWQEGAWVPIEVTWTTRGRSYDEARSTAREQIERSRIEWAVDVAAARTSGIASLPGRPCTTTFNHWEARSLDERTRTLSDAAADTLKNLIVEVLESGYPAEEGKQWEIQGFRAAIGRGYRHDVSLLEATVSDPHAVIFIDGTEIRVTDLLSKNGTSVEGSRVPPNGSLPIQVGQVFQVGRVKLRLNHSSNRR